MNSDRDHVSGVFISWSYECHIVKGLIYGIGGGEESPEGVGELNSLRLVPSRRAEVTGVGLF